MEFTQTTTNFMFMVYIIFILLGAGVILWILFKEDKQKERLDKETEEKLEDLRRKLLNSEIKIKNLTVDLETAKKANEALQLQFKELKDKSEQSDNDFRKLQESNAIELKAKQDLKNLNEELERQLNETKDKLAKLISGQNVAKESLEAELKAAKEEATKYKESCQILEKALKQKEGVVEEELPKPPNEKQVTEKPSESKISEENSTDTESTSNE